MAEYHLNAKFFTRSKGQSAVAAAAYRAGERLHDQRTHLTHDYTRKKGIEATEILVPENAPGWMRDRSQLWNEVEKAEKRKDSQLCLEFDIALPVELSRDQQKAALRNFAQEQFVQQGYAVDIAYHAMDTHNPHAHLMVPLRPIESGKFGKKPNRWGTYNSDLREWRESWARHANRVLEQNGHDDRIDHRTLKERDIDRTPQIHIGKNAWHGQKEGVEYDRWSSVKLIANDNEIRQALRVLEEHIAREEERQRRLLDQTTAAIVDGTLPDRSRKKNIKRKSPEKSRQEAARDNSATTLAGTFAAPSQEPDAGKQAPTPGKVEDQRRVIEQFQTIKDAGRERSRRVPDGARHSKGQGERSPDGSPAQRPQSPRSHPPPLDYNPAGSAMSSPEIVAALSDAARQSPNTPKLARLAEWALQNADREDKPWERARMEYLRELGRKVRSRGTDALYDPNTDADIAIRLRLAGFTWKDISGTVVKYSPIAGALPSKEHQSAYLNSMIKPCLTAPKMWREQQEMVRWRLNKDKPERQTEYRLDRLGLATELPPKTVKPHRQHDIERER